MKDYETIKKELKARCKNIKGFNKEFYKTYCNDLQAIKKEIEKATKENKKVSVTELWILSDTHKTYLYNNNSGVYCAFLEIV